MHHACSAYARLLQDAMCAACSAVRTPCTHGVIPIQGFRDVSTASMRVREPWHASRECRCLQGVAASSGAPAWQRSRFSCVVDAAGPAGRVLATCCWVPKLVVPAAVTAGNGALLAILRASAAICARAAFWLCRMQGRGFIQVGAGPVILPSSSTRRHSGRNLLRMGCGGGGSALATRCLCPECFCSELCM